MGNYYDDQKISSIERAKLAEDILLPELPKEPLTLEYLKNIGEYKLAINEYTDVVGKFFLTIMTPLIDKGEAVEAKKTAPSTRGHKGQGLPTNSYTSSNFISLTIPKYIVLNFKDVIPKGTEFIVASVGGSIELEDLRIVGLYTLTGSMVESEAVAKK